MFNRIALIVIAILVALLLAAIYLFTGTARYTVEACVTYGGRSACRTASASTREQALRTAVANACASLSRGRQDALVCENTPPGPVTWK